jgi:hypothetical protein
MTQTFFDLLRDNDKNTPARHGPGVFEAGSAKPFRGALRKTISLLHKVFLSCAVSSARKFYGPATQGQLPTIGLRATGSLDYLPPSQNI